MKVVELSARGWFERDSLSGGAGFAIECPLCRQDQTELTIQQHLEDVHRHHVVKITEYGPSGIDDRGHFIVVGYTCVRPPEYPPNDVHAWRRRLPVLVAGRTVLAARRKVTNARLLRGRIRSAEPELFWCGSHLIKRDAW